MPGPDGHAQRSRSSKGGLAALTAFYDRYGARAYALAAEMLADDDAAATIVEAVFVDLWRHAPAGVPPGEAVQRWLLTEIHLRCVAALRGLSRAPDLAETGAMLAGEPRATGREPCADPRVIQGVLDALPAERRAMLELAYFQAQTCAQIASQHRVSRGVVHRQLRQALEEVQRCSKR